MSPAPTTRPIAASYVSRIASARVYDVAIESPLDYARRLSARLDNSVLLKREDLQPVFSFKLRGAYNKIAQAPRAMIERGVICSSAGNHAQGVALAARKHGLDATIVMPTTAAPIKVEAVAALGGEVVLEGLTYDDANRFALDLAREDRASVRAPVRRSRRDRGPRHDRARARAAVGRAPSRRSSCRSAAAA